MNLVATVAVGGALGAVGRYVVMSQIGHWLGAGFPWGTLAVNMIGSFAMGIIVEAGALLWSPSSGLRAMIVVGVLGAFTTFSTFSLDVVVLVERGATTAAVAYIAVSVALSIGALFAGLHLLRMLSG